MNNKGSRKNKKQESKKRRLIWALFQDHFKRNLSFRLPLTAYQFIMYYKDTIIGGEKLKTYNL